MKEFDWSEVVDYLNNNLDKEFDFGNTFYENECCCLMASFFKDKRVKFNKVNYSGFLAVDKNCDPVAAVIGAPFKGIERIHSLPKSHTMGRDIKEKLDEVLGDCS